MTIESAFSQTRRRWVVLIAGTGMSLGLMASLVGPVASAEQSSSSAAMPVSEPVVAPAKKKPKPKPIRNSSFAFIGEVVSFESDLDDDGGGGVASNALADPVVGRLGDGTYIMLALRGTRSKPYVAWRSKDLVTWERYAEYDCAVAEPVEGPCQGRLIGFQSMEDGRLRVFFLVYGPQVIRSAVTADGVTWEQEWDVKLSGSDFPEMEYLETGYITQMPDGSYRMYITALDCEALNLRGRPNCSDFEPDPDPFVPMPSQRLAHTYLSASSPDGVTWTPDPGVRWQASKRNGSLQRIGAWTTPAGKVQIISNDTSMHKLDKASFITLESDDGLTFRKVSDQQILMADPHFVTDPDGRTVIFSSGMGPESRGGILRWEIARTTWVANDAKLTGLGGDAATYATYACFSIRVRGTGRLLIDVKGDNRIWDDRGFADPRLYRLSARKLKAPGVIRIQLTQEDQRNPANVGRPDFPRYVTLTEAKTGVIRVIPLFWGPESPSALKPCFRKR